MIKNVEFHNFKALRKVNCELQRFTVIAGPNACGKTSLLQGLEILAMLPWISSKTQMSAHRSPTVMISHGNQGLELIARFTKYQQKELRGFKVKVSPSDDDTGKPDWNFREFLFEGNEWKPSGRYKFAAFKRVMNAAFLRLDPDDIGKHSLKELPGDTFSNTGRGLPTHLAGMAATAPDDYSYLLEAVRNVVPTFVNIAFANVKIPHVNKLYDEHDDAYRETTVDRPGFAITLDMSTVSGIAAEHVSEGTLLTLCLLAKLLGPDHPRLILLDNLESGLHPKALGVLIQQLRAIMEKYPDLQIVATTHSPYLLDHFAPKEIRLMCSDADGYAVFGSLTDHPDFKRWKDEMLPGEFWSMIGEDWLLKKEKPKKTTETIVKKKVAKKKVAKNKIAKKR